MNKTTQRAVIIDNISSPYIEQAIIILRDYSSSNESKVISDAEKIVREYLEKIKTDDSDITIYNRPQKSLKKPKISKLKAAGIYILAAAAALLLYLVLRV